MMKKAKVLLLVFSVLALLFFGCESSVSDTESDPKTDTDNEPSYTYVAEYVVSGSGIVDIYLTNETGGSDTHSDVVISSGKDFRYSLSSFDDNFLYISAQLGSEGGTVTVDVYYRGIKKDTETSNGAFSIATANYLIK